MATQETIRCTLVLYTAEKYSEKMMLGAEGLSKGNAGVCLFIFKVHVMHCSTQVLSLDDEASQLRGTRRNKQALGCKAHKGCPANLEGQSQAQASAQQQDAALHSVCHFRMS